MILPISTLSDDFIEVFSGSPKEHPEKAKQIKIERSDANEFIRNYCNEED
jgi:hypothetical protein